MAMSSLQVIEGQVGVEGVMDAAGEKKSWKNQLFYRKFLQMNKLIYFTF